MRLALQRSTGSSEICSTSNHLLSINSKNLVDTLPKCGKSNQMQVRSYVLILLDSCLTHVPLVLCSSLFQSHLLRLFMSLNACLRNKSKRLPVSSLSGCSLCCARCTNKRRRNSFLRIRTSGLPGFRSVCKVVTLFMSRHMHSCGGTQFADAINLPQNVVGRKCCIRSARTLPIRDILVSYDPDVSKGSFMVCI